MIIQAEESFPALMAGTCLHRQPLKQVGQARKVEMTLPTKCAVRNLRVKMPKNFCLPRKERVNGAHPFPSQAPRNKYGKSKAAIFFRSLLIILVLGY